MGLYLRDVLTFRLYEQIPEDVRKNYCSIWKGLVLQDDDLIKSHCDQLGIENYKLFAILIAMRSYDGYRKNNKTYTLFQCGSGNDIQNV